MKYAYYTVASSQEMKDEILSQLKDQAKGDDDYYGAYIDVAPEYNGAIQDRRAWRSLQTAARNRRIQIVVIQSMDSLHMGQLRAFSMLMRLQKHGVQIALRDPRTILSDDELLKLAVDEQTDYFMTQLAVPLLVSDDCLVHYGCSTAYICLGTDPHVHEYFRESETMYFSDAVEKYQDTGFFLYRTDKKGWYHISSTFAQWMNQFFLENVFPF